MHPTLFKIGSYPVHAYGVLIATGFVLAVLLIRAEAKKAGWSTELIVDWCFMALLVGFVGSRVFFILTRLVYYKEHPVEIFYVWEGGLVFYGGPLFVMPWTVWFTKKHKLSLAKLCDMSVQGLVLAHAIGRLGCLAAGCCYGKPTALPWGIKLFSDLVEPSLRGVSLHPSQLYESLLLLGLFVFLRWRRKYKKFDGELCYLYFLVYPILRSILEIFRGDVIRGFIIHDVISTSQFISILVFMAALALYIKKLGQGKKRS